MGDLWHNNINYSKVKCNIIVWKIWHFGYRKPDETEVLNINIQNYWQRIYGLWIIGLYWKRHVILDSRNFHRKKMRSKYSDAQLCIFNDFVQGAILYTLFIYIIIYSDKWQAYFRTLNEHRFIHLENVFNPIIRPKLIW